MDFKHKDGDALGGMQPAHGSFILPLERSRTDSAAHALRVFRAVMPYQALTWMHAFGKKALTQAQVEMLSKGVEVPSAPEEEKNLALRFLQAGARALELAGDGKFSFSEEFFVILLQALSGAAEPLRDSGAGFAFLEQRVKDRRLRAFNGFLYVLWEHPGSITHALAAALFLNSALASWGWCPASVPAKDDELFALRLSAFMRDGRADGMLRFFESVLKRVHAAHLRFAKSNGAQGRAALFPDFPAGM